MEPRLSIVVPFFGVQDYIGACLRSIACQALADFEVVLVDDGSTDDSAAIARDFVERDRRFRIVTQENQGLGPARNTGVKHSVGDYIAFVDSDDVVPRNGYEVMLRTLDETGSSFAGGDVRRFNSKEVRPSLLHRVPFAQQRLATHVLEFPELATDRIICNKVFRRSFWDEFGFEFPAIRYEDYPVSIRSHLDAVTVDCVATPVYFWRFRESGQSITDQSHEYGNLLDRVTSAEMVIDVVARRAPQLRTRVHRHLLRVDLVPLLQAFRTAPSSEAQRVVRLGQRFVSRLDASALESAPRLQRLQIHALQNGDVAFLRRLAAFRDDHGGFEENTPARRRRLMRWQYEHGYPGLTDRPRRAPRSLYRVGKNEFGLHTTVTDIRWLGTSVVVRGTAEIRHLRMDGRSRLRAFLTGDGVDVPCAVTRFTTTDSRGDAGLVGYEISVEGDTFASLPKGTNVVHLCVEAVNGRVRRSGAIGGLQTGSPVFAEGCCVRQGLWVQSRQQPGGTLGFELLHHPAQLASVTQAEGAFVLSGSFRKDRPAAHLVLTRPSSGDAQVVRLDLLEEDSEVRFTCRLPLADVVDGFGFDDPLGERTTWTLRLDDESESPLVPTGLDHAVGVVHDSLLVTLTRNPTNSAVLHVSPVQFFVDRVEPTSRQRLVVRGPTWDRKPLRSVVWRSFPEDSDDSLAVPCETSSSSRRWSADVDLDDLMTDRTASRRTDDVLSPTTWTLFAIAEDGCSHAVQVDEFLAGQLPIEAAHRGRTAKLVPDAGRLRLVVP